MIDFFSRLDKFMIYKGLNDNKLTIEAKISNGLIGKARKRGALSQENISKILYAYPELDANWLFTGKGSMLIEDKAYQGMVSEPPAEYGSPNKRVNATLLKLPIEAMAGILNGGDIQVMDYECDEYVVPLFIAAEASFLIPVLGDSMSPEYDDGNLVACKKMDSWSSFNPGRVYVAYTSHGVVVKRLFHAGLQDHILFVSDNKKYQAFELHKKEIKGIALVIGGVWLE